jgi:hypothetical protein
VCTGSTFTYNPTYVVSTPPTIHDISYTSPLSFSWISSTKRQVVDITLTGTLPDSRSSTFLFKVIVTNQCESATTTFSGSVLDKDYIVKTTADPILSFPISTFGTSTPSGCPLTYTFDVWTEGSTVASSKTSYSVFSIS